jgi:hypothetical protein
MLDACLFSQAVPLGQSFKAGRSFARLFFPCGVFPLGTTPVSIGVAMLSTLKHAYKSLLWYIEQDAEAYAILLFGSSFIAAVVCLAVLNAR